MDWNGVLDLTKQLGGILVVVFYAAIVLWTYKDAKRRLDDPILIATAVACSMLPIVGVFVYMLLRPPEYLADVRERELETIALQRQLGSQERCPKCRSHIERDYLSCPVCETKLREECVGCSRPLDPRWAMCPFCEAPTPRSGPTPPSGGGRRREAAPATSRSTKVGRERPATRGDAPARREPPRRKPDADAFAAPTVTHAQRAPGVLPPVGSPAAAASAAAVSGTPAAHAPAPTATIPSLLDVDAMRVEPLQPGTPAR